MSETIKLHGVVKDTTQDDLLPDSTGHVIDLACRVTGCGCIVHETERVKTVWAAGLSGQFGYHTSDCPMVTRDVLNAIRARAVPSCRYTMDWVTSLHSNEMRYLVGVQNDELPGLLGPNRYRGSVRSTIGRPFKYGAMCDNSDSPAEEYSRVLEIRTPYTQKVTLNYYSNQPYNVVDGSVPFYAYRGLPWYHHRSVTAAMEAQLWEYLFTDDTAVLSSGPGWLADTWYNRDSGLTINSKVKPIALMTQQIQQADRKFARFVGPASMMKETLKQLTAQAHDIMGWLAVCMPTFDASKLDNVPDFVRVVAREAYGYANECPIVEFFRAYELNEGDGEE